MKLIAALRKVHPVTGKVFENLDVPALANKFTEYGASAIAVMTAPSAQGSAEWITQVRDNSTLPILRHEHVSDQDEVTRTKDLGADWLTVSCDQMGMFDIEKVVHRCFVEGLRPVLEVGSHTAISKMKKIDPGYVLINGRDGTGKLDPSRYLTLAKMIPDKYAVIAHGGIKKREAVESLKALNYDYVMVCNQLLDSEDLKTAFLNLGFNSQKTYRRINTTLTDLQPTNN